MIKRIVTHGSKAHFDEFFAVGLLVALKFNDLSPEDIPDVYRRDPSDTELDDPEVAVIDIGGRHNPDRYNFDHHHDESLPSSFRLVARHFFVEGRSIDSLLDQAHEWYGYKDVLDREGPNAAAHSVDVHGDTLPLKSPIESWIINQFSDTDSDGRVQDEIPVMAALIARQQIDRASELSEKIEEFREIGDVETFGGLSAFVVDEEPDSYAFRQLREEMGFDVTLSVNPRDEGGIAVYRYNDVDLDLKEAAYTAFPEGGPIQFAHNSGFFAVCRDGESAREVLRSATRLSDSYASA